MSEAAAQNGANVPEYSVSEIAGALKRTVEDAYGFVRVRGELGRVVVAKSGHLYTDLKDDKATLGSVMWKGGVGKLNFKPEEGLEVIAEGRLTTYPARSQYQLIIERMAPAGVGALMALLEERKKKLAVEGLFETDRKRAIPRHPEVVGVVTSPTGAVIRDILHRVAERFPRHVLIWPALVQGQEAAKQVAAGIEGFNRFTRTGETPPRPDVIIVARGGGSIEDLWPFNEEIVVRAAAASEIPLISAVGHETDWTLIDLASDLRAPTPTGAAEVVTTPPRGELAAGLDTYGGRLGRAVSRMLEGRTAALTSAARGMPRLEDLIGQRAQRLDMASQRLRSGLKALADRSAIRFQRAAAGLRPQALVRDIADKRTRLNELAGRVDAAERRALRDKQRHLEQVAARLSGLDPKSVLKRGFSIVRGPDGAIARGAAALGAGDVVEMEFADGKRSATVRDGAASSGGDESAKRKPDAKREKKTAKRSDQQGALF